MRVHALRRFLLWTLLQSGFLAVCTAQSLPDQFEPAEFDSEEVDALPKYQIEIIAFAYHDFDPTEERFEQPPRGTLSDLLNPTLLETEERQEFDDDALELELVPEPERYLPDALAIEPIEVIEIIEEPFVDSSDGDLLGPVFPDANNADAPVASEFDDGTVVAEENPPDEVLLEEDPNWYRILSSTDLELKDTFDRLDRLDAYTPLIHGGWIQEGLPEEESLPFDLALLGRFNPLGTIRLHVSRFLHVTVALRYQSKRATDELPSAAYGDLAEIELPPQYDLNIQRRTRSGELHFFDHPAFGVLVLVQPAPEELEILEDELAPAA